MEEPLQKEIPEEPMLLIEGISEQETKEISKILQRFIKAYAEKDAADTNGIWLTQQLAKELPEKTEKEIREITIEIRTAVEEYDKNLEELHSACEQGIAKETWFANKISEAAESVSIIEFGNYLSSIDKALTNANAQMVRTVTTKTGAINQCVNLDGFLAEQYAVNTFNLHAKLEGSPYIAEVKVPEVGEMYGLNSFDTVIKDSTTGKIVHQYQFKFGKDAKATIALLKDGDYHNQRFVVPEEQVEAVKQAFPQKSVTSCMGGTDKVTVCSSPLTKEKAKQLQVEAQEQGKVLRQDWNVYNTKELALHIGEKASCLGLQAMLLTTGFQLVEKTVKEEPVSVEEVVETAFLTGTDTGIKEAIAGALKVATERGVITIIPKGTAPDIFAKIACISIENTKIFIKVARGELDLSQAMELIGESTVAFLCGISWSATGAMIGAAALSWIPFVGSVVGGIAGGVVGYMAGSEVGKAVYSGVKKVGEGIKTIATSVWNGVKSVGSKVASGVRSVIGGLFGR